MHARGVLANDRQKTLAALTIFHCSCLERFHKSKYRGERRAQLMRDVREEFLSYDLQTFSSSDVKERTGSEDLRLMLVIALTRRINWTRRIRWVSEQENSSQPEGNAYQD